MTARTKMPPERNGITKVFRLGELTVYGNVGLQEDGTPGEVFLKGQKVGSFERGLLDCLAVMISLALQYGVSIESIAGKLIGTQFAPAGPTRDAEIPWARSIADYLGRWLLKRFGKEKNDETGS
jgi:ribonucleoside-diphosphate reductase alpha chain